MPGLKFLPGAILEGAKGEAQVSDDIQFAGLVVGVKLFVAGGETSAVYQTASADKLTPQIVAVAAYQGVVQIKNGQCHRVRLKKWVASIAGVPVIVNFSGLPKYGTIVRSNNEWRLK